MPLYYDIASKNNLVRLKKLRGGSLTDYLADPNIVLYDNINPPPQELIWADYITNTVDSKAFALADGGTKIFVINQESGNSIVYRIDLLLANELDTGGILNGSRNINPFISNNDVTGGITLSDVGNKMHVGDQIGSIRELNLNNYDLTVLSTSGIGFLTGFGAGNLGQHIFCDDGFKIYVIDTSTDRLYRWDLTSAYAVSTISAVNNVPAGESNIVGCYINNAGTKVFYLTSAGMLHEYSMSTPYDTTTLADTGRSVDIADETGGSSFQSIFFSDDGLFYYINVNAPNPQKLIRFTASAAFQL